jgi:hypothetical protein
MQNEITLSCFHTVYLFAPYRNVIVLCSHFFFFLLILIELNLREFLSEILNKNGKNKQFLLSGDLQDANIYHKLQFE